MSRNESENNLTLGSNVIDRILPFKRPLVMVDNILSYHRRPEPRMTACRHISSNETIFDGHFPDLHIWPGIYTQEGMGQTGAMLTIIQGLQQYWEEQGRDPEEILEALRNLERGFKLHPGFKLEASREFLDLLPQAQRYVEMVGAVDLKFLRPVFAGQRLDYEVTLVKKFEQMLRLRVDASVNGEPVARGTMTSTFAHVRPVGRKGD